MKTPREIITEKHCEAVPKLDQSRATALGELNSAPEKSEASVPFLQRMVSTLWREVFLPCRTTWNALAVIWVGILIVSAAMRFDSTPQISTGSVAELTPEIQEQLQQQRELIATLLDLPEVEPAKEELPEVPGNQRSQIIRRFQYC